MGRILVSGAGGIATHLIVAALISAGHETVATNPPHTKIVNIPELEPIDCSGWNTKKTKGDKHRDRAARRRKWGI